MTKNKKTVGTVTPKINKQIKQSKANLTNIVETNIMDMSTIETVLKLKKQKKGYVAFLQEELNVSKEEAKRIGTDILAGSNSIPTVEQEEVNEAEETIPAAIEEDWQEKLVVKEGYTYNKDNDKYVLFLKSAGKQIVVPGEQHRAMFRAYSNWDGKSQSVNELCKNNAFPVNWFKEYKSIFQWTHDLEPVTKEELNDVDPDKIVNDLIQRKRFEIHQKFHKADWKQTQEDADKWRQFQLSKLDPFQAALDNFNPKPIKPIASIKKNKSKDVFVVGLSDLHFGAIADAEELNKGEDYNAVKSVEIIDAYTAKIAEDVANNKNGYERCVVCVVGDILHTLTGRTEKGTFLESEVLREAQFELAFNCLTQFFTRMIEIFGKVEVQVVKGNHSGVSEYILFKAIQAYFNKEDKVVFHLYKCRSVVFKINNTAVLMDHGDSDYIKAKVPTTDMARERYVQNRFLENTDKIIGCNSRIFIQGDLHHYQQHEYTSFEFYMFSSIVAGDRYADHLGLHSRPRQNCLVIGEEGVKASLHYYFDVKGVK